MKHIIYLLVVTVAETYKNMRYYLTPECADGHTHHYI